jgi:hypothetical protein
MNSIEGKKRKVFQKIKKQTSRDVIKTLLTKFLSAPASRRVQIDSKRPLKDAYIKAEFPYYKKNQHKKKTNKYYTANLRAAARP